VAISAAGRIAGIALSVGNVAGLELAESTPKRAFTLRSNRRVRHGESRIQGTHHEAI